jgi:hypothetical protein
MPMLRGIRYRELIPPDYLHQRANRMVHVSQPGSVGEDMVLTTAYVPTAYLSGRFASCFPHVARIFTERREAYVLR